MNKKADEKEKVGGPIGQAELEEFLQRTPDFVFELQCLHLLTRLEFDCDHGGSYSDPITQKTRQFDIRIYKKLGLDSQTQICCAIECKNLSKENPLLVYCVTRSSAESFHHVLTSHPGPVFCTTSHVKSDRTPYREGTFVGKSCTQVSFAKDQSRGVKYSSTDSEVYDRYAQALASIEELGNKSAHASKQFSHDVHILLLPILVVPDGTLWRAGFDVDGRIVADPIAVDHCSFWVDRKYRIGNPIVSTELTISHLEFVTLTGLKHLMTEVKSNKGHNHWFPQLQVLRYDGP